MSLTYCKISTVLYSVKSRLDQGRLTSVWGAPTMFEVHSKKGIFMKKLLLILSIFGLASTASATIVFSPGVSYSSNDTDTGSGTSSGSELLLDVKLGYIFPMGFYVGGIYHNASNSAGSAVNDEKATAFGPSVGYFSPMGFYVTGHYFLVAERNDYGVAGGDASEGTGPQVDLGWVFPLTSVFSMGPQLTYRSLNYSKADVGGVATDIDVTRTEIRPYISLFFMF